MLERLLDTVQLWRNPAFARFRRSRLRFRKAVFWYLLTAIVTTFVVTLVYLVRTNSLTSPETAARGLWVPLLVIQGLILMVKGTGSVSAGLIQDKIDETLDYQRLTPVTPMRNLVGYLFGLPVLEYAMVALTLPHLVFIVVVGRIPLGTVLAVYFAFFLCAILYHTTAIAAGMVMRRWFLGYLLGILLVFFVNLVLPMFISQFGLKFLQYLSVWPVIGEKVLPLTVSGASLARVVSQNPFFAMASDVPFFAWSLSPFVFTLLLQGLLVVTFVTMSLRRWQSATKHSLSKPYALGALCAFIVLLIGNVWPIITHQYMPFALFGQNDINRLGTVITIGLPLVYAVITWLLCLVLFSIVIPSRVSYVRGIRRAIKHGRTAAPLWDDDAGSIGLIAAMTAIALAGFWVLSHQIATSGFLDDVALAQRSAWRLPLAFGLVVLYTGLVLQVLELRPTVLVVLLVWVLPVLIGIVASAGMQSAGPLHFVIASISPIAYLLMSGFAATAAIAPGEMENEIGFLLTGATSGLAFVVVQIGFLFARWQKQKRADYAECCNVAAESGADERIVPASH